MRAARKCAVGQILPAGQGLRTAALVRAGNSSGGQVPSIDTYSLQLRCIGGASGCDACNRLLVHKDTCSFALSAFCEQNEDYIPIYIVTASHSIYLNIFYYYLCLYTNML